jgi:hypothetical protein
MPAEMWFYTCEGKQMDPVSIKELKRLVGDGVLKPTDMVWKEGMARWIRASSVKELFPDPTSALDQFFTSSAKDADKPGGQKFNQASSLGLPTSKPGPDAAESATPMSAPAAADDEPRTQKRRPTVNDDDDLPSRRGKPAAAGSSVGILLALILGGGVVLVALIVGVVILISVSGGNTKNPGIDPNNLIRGPVTYNVQLAHDQRLKRTFSFKKGVDYEFIVKTQPNVQGVDVDLYIFDINNLRDPIALDIDPQADCRLRWTPNQDGQFHVELHRCPPVMPQPGDFAGANVQCVVTIREVTQAPPDKKEPGGDEPLPADVKKGKGSFGVEEFKGGQEEVYKFLVKAGHKSKINVFAIKRPEVDFDLHVLKDADGAAIRADTGPLHTAVVEFSVPATQVVRVRVLNKGKATSRCTVFYDLGE